MASIYAYTPYIWPSVFVAILLFTLSIIGWQRRDIPGALPFAISNLFATIWVGASAFQLATVDISSQIFWFKVQALCQLPTITCMACFLLEFVWPGRFLTRRNVILLAIPVFLYWGGALTNSYHHLSWREFTIDGTLAPTRGPLNTFLIVYGLGLAFINLFAITWLFVRSPQNRWLAFIMFLSLGSTRAIYLLVMAGRIHTILPLTALSNVIPFIVYAIALFRFRVLDPIPLAQKMAIEQLNAGILVLDFQGKILSLNPAGAAVFGESTRQLLGKRIQHLMPECTSLFRDPPDMGSNQMEVCRGADTEAHYYQLECSALYDWHGLRAGHLLLLQDITMQKQAQTQLIEQQQALATLKEREQIARELHDELSQELAMINVQSQFISSLLEIGQEAKAREQLQLLAKVARNTQVDVRGQISKLLLSADPSEGFLVALRSFMDWFRQMNAIETELVLPNPLPQVSLSPMVEVQLLRIVQEVLTNVRKHAQAKKVLLTLTREPDRLELSIEDDGIGFDPSNLASPSSSFGLGIISARAKEIGGSVTVLSIPSQGTRIVVVAPCS